ncbi:hypothetical protein [Actinoplanes sp. NPDC048796]|uniref:hypothetical protein n=1 Tax=Actinoplanes sp. NPDC048796 TaxID=3155640 RepID=UPI0033CACB23
MAFLRQGWKGSSSSAAAKNWPPPRTGERQHADPAVGHRQLGRDAGRHPGLLAGRHPGADPLRGHRPFQSAPVVDDPEPYALGQQRQLGRIVVAGAQIGRPVEAENLLLGPAQHLIEDLTDLGRADHRLDALIGGLVTTLAAHPLAEPETGLLQLPHPVEQQRVDGQVGWRRRHPVAVHRDEPLLAELVHRRPDFNQARLGTVGERGNRGRAPAEHLHVDPLFELAQPFSSRAHP